MTEGEQQVPQEEVRKENPVVGAARAAARGVIETDESIKAWRDTLTVKDKSVYRAWIEATDNYINSMTETDRNKLSTKMLRLKNYLGAAVLGVSSWTIDNVVNLASKGLKIAGVAAVGAIALPAIPFSWGLVGAGLGLYAAGGIGEAFHKGRVVDKLKTMRLLKLTPGGKWLVKLSPGLSAVEKLQQKDLPPGFTRRIGVGMAERYEKKKVESYKRRLSQEQLKDFNSFVKQRAKDIVTGFAYPEGKPVKPMAK